MSDRKLLLNNLIYLVHSFITAISPFVFSFKYFRVLPQYVINASCSIKTY